MREPWGSKGIIPGRGSITSTGLICTQKPVWLRGGSPRLETVEELRFHPQCDGRPLVDFEQGVM